MHVNRENLAWAAGFIDGEGHFGFHVSNKKISDGTVRGYGSLSLNIAQKDRQVLDKFREIVGKGKVYGPYTHGRGPSITYFGYYSHNFEATQAIIAMVWEWLSPVKREQAKKILAAFQVYKDRPKLPLGRKIKGRTPAICHPDRLSVAKKLCNACYLQSRKRL